MKNRIPAFTLTELIIVMVISGIAVSGIFSIFYISSGLFKKTGTQKNTENEWVLLDKHLTKDMFACDSLIVSERTLIFYSDKQMNTYVFSDSIVERISNGTIRYDVRVKNLQPLYHNPSLPFIDQVIMISAFHNKDVTSIYQKMYPATITLNYALRNK